VTTVAAAAFLGAAAADLAGADLAGADLAGALRAAAALTGAGAERGRVAIGYESLSTWESQRITFEGHTARELVVRPRNAGMNGQRLDARFKGPSVRKIPRLPHKVLFETILTAW